MPIHPELDLKIPPTLCRWFINLYKNKIQSLLFFLLAARLARREREEYHFYLSIDCKGNKKYDVY